MSDAITLSMPQPGSHQLRIISPTVLELALVNSKRPDPARVDRWDFVDDAGQFFAPAMHEFAVLSDGQAITIQSVGFQRRPLYAPLRQRDLRLNDHIYLKLATPISDGTTVVVQNPSSRLWSADWQFKTKADSLRYSPAIHVNRVGYLPGFPKTALVGYYLGNLGELTIPESSTFQVIDHTTGGIVFEGALTRRADTGYQYTPKPYQNVWEADFSGLTTPGKYRVRVPGLGTSWPFRIDEGAALALTRAYALGLYHQRCGTANELPYTRFTHGPCHTASAAVPDRSLAGAEHFLSEATANASLVQAPSTPPLNNFDAGFYPFANRGQVDVAGGHHDAGDYSKYTINSAGLIHILTFAVDAFPSVAELDNLGLPESGDGISDLLQEAKWEADFLAKMQDADGGFYYLVYPRNRAYESDVLPDRGDPQIVWPKTTAVTAAAVAALAQCASSPHWQKHYPETARLYLEKARKGWAFLSKALTQHGEDGSYQKLLSYGNEFAHDDEIAWAACEMFLATGDQAYHQVLRDRFDPDDPKTRRWTWWRMYDAYGHALGSYALATRTGRRSASELDSVFLKKCEQQILAAGDDMLARSRQNAYGTSLPLETKGVRSAGWYFSSEQAFDIAVASLLRPGPDLVRGFLYNVNYEAGCNPVNVCFVTGLGLKRQREIVHQYAMNDQRVLPPTGFPLGNIQDHLPYLEFYRGELGRLTFPSDGAPSAPYPSYDRWTDSFNVMTEFTIVHQARSLAGIALLAIQTSLKNQAWKPSQARITGLPRQSGVNVPVTARVEAPGLNLEEALIVWEARDQEPSFGRTLTLVPTQPGLYWVEVEVQMPDGRRVFGAAEFLATDGSLAVTSLGAAPANGRRP